MASIGIPYHFNIWSQADISNPVPKLYCISGVFQGADPTPCKINNILRGLYWKIVPFLHS